MSIINKKILKFLTRRIIKKYRPKIIGVAGGKETAEAKKMISRVLASKFSTRSSGNFFDGEANILSAIIGVEAKQADVRQRVISTIDVFASALRLILTRQSYPKFLILEIETDQAGEVKSLLKIARPETGIIVWTEKLSGGEHDSKNFKQSIREKNLLIKFLRKNELAVLNYDDKATRNIIDGTRAKIITFGFGEKAEIRAMEVNKKEIRESSYFGGNSRHEQLKKEKEVVSFKINYQNSFVPIHLTRQQIYPALAAAAVGLNYGLNLVEIAEALSFKHSNI